MPRMKTAAALIVGFSLGCVVALSWVFVASSWYEYRILDGNDNPVAMVNQDGWELVLYERPIWQFRRPRYRLH